LPSAKNIEYGEGIMANYVELTDSNFEEEVLNSDVPVKIGRASCRERV